MFEWMVEDNHIDVDGEVVKRVRDLITSNDADAPADKKFLWDIVANKRNSVDVDKSSTSCATRTTPASRGAWTLAA